MNTSCRIAYVAVFSAVFLVQTAKSDNENHEPILPELSPTPQLTVSTVSPNGDQNPYGVAFVPGGFPDGGPLEPGDILVSNFNNATIVNGGNQQGTGTTIVRITPGGKQSAFFQFKGTDQVGLTTALGILRAGFVLVGNVPAGAVSTPPTAKSSLFVLDRHGHISMEIPDLDGPWDLTINDLGFFAQVFVSNVLSGTVTRLDVLALGAFFKVLETTQIASGYMHRTDPTAFAIGPTGLAYDRASNVLYVASTADNAIFAIKGAGTTNHDHGTGTAIYTDTAHLHGPLGLLRGPNGNLITANGDAINPDPNHLNELVEFTPSGHFVAQFQIDSGGAGAAFGIAVASSDDNVRFAAVDDNTNQLKIWNVH